MSENAAHIDFNTQLSLNDFPHTTEKGRIKATIPNLKHVFKQYGIECQYDEILKKQTIILANNSIDDNDLSESSTFSQIQSLLALNDVPTRCVDLVPALMEQNRINPVLDFIRSKPWDGTDRLPEFLNSLVIEGHDTHYRNLAVKTWLIQCVAAADSARNSPLKHAIAKFELVLVLQGSQGAMKTTWFKSLLPASMKDYIVDGAHLNPDDKDAVKRCISCWICELGELDATFRKSDIAQLKGFLSKERDNFRLPYGRSDSSFRRRTSFGATVNPKTFLVDDTGARRFLPLAVSQCLPINTDMQQLWAQAWHLYSAGHQWWCSNELDKLLTIIHLEHSEVSPISELIANIFNMNEPVKRLYVDLRFNHLSATQIVIECGINPPTKEHVRQARVFLEGSGFKCVQSTSNQRGYWITKDLKSE
ncbi:MAG: VapE domain-containing protein [Methylococcaceae bacterium]